MSSFKFLTNEICEFEVLTRHHLLTNKKNVDVISSVFFKREKYYKNYNIYTKGISKLLKFLGDKKNNDLDNGGYVYLLFIDKHVAEDKEIRKWIDNCSVCVPIIFKCSEYIINDYHIDLFGTMMRFFPMFDFEDNPCNIVICTDIDLHDDDYFRLENLMRKRHAGINAAGDIARHLYMNIKPYVYAGTFSYNLPRMEKEFILNYIRNADKVESKGNYGKRETPYGYGIDEIFVNDYFLPKVGDVGITIEYQPCYFLYHSKPYMTDKSRIDNSSEILSTILGPYGKDNMDFEQKLKAIDKATYQVRERTDTNNEISIRFTKVLDYLTKNKKTWLEKPVQQFIHKYLRNVISTIIVIHYNYKCECIKNAKLFNTVYDTESENAKL